MRKIVSALLIMLLFIGILAACTERSEPDLYTEPPEPEETTPLPMLGSILSGFLNYEIFLSLLEVNGFSFEEAGETYGLLSVTPRVLSLGDEFLTIYEYDSKEAMELDSSLVRRGGSLIEQAPNEEGYSVSTNVSWASYPHWFRKDLLIVLYVGEDDGIINFLMENLNFFAGWRAPPTGNPSLQDTVEIPALPPGLSVRFSTEGSPAQELQTAQLSATWDPNIDAEGNRIEDGPWSGVMNASADHPLDIFVLDFNNSDGLTVYLDGADGKIELEFSNNFLPHSVYVRRWNAEFAVSVNGGGSDMALWSQYESVTVSDNIIFISDDGNDYIYEVDAIWPQGRSSYTFRINSTSK